MHPGAGTNAGEADWEIRSCVSPYQMIMLSNDDMLDGIESQAPGGAIREVCNKLAALAPLEGSRSHLLQAWRMLHEHGVSRSPLPSRFGGRALGVTPQSAAPAVDQLISVGSADLSVGRVLEGHINAIRLVAAYGSDAQNRRVALVVEGGGALGVWGADEGTAVTIDSGKLSGTKRYCSGLGVVHLAVVPVRSGTEQQLVLVSTTDHRRADAAAWAMHGMRATHSGRYSFDGMSVSEDDRLGKPGDFTREPLFFGGAWRIAAVELGGVFGLIEATRACLSRRGRLGNPIQVSRLGDLLVAAHAARALAVAAARHAESDDALNAPDHAARHSILARLAAERIAEEAMGVAARSVGLEGLVSGSTLERRLRDLGTYIRQAAPDELKLRVSSAMLEHPSPLAGALDGH
jgi:alkylation response protein AidB-like acyl-CoA dehydrogenase